MITQDDWNRLARFATGECTAEEAEALERWIGDEPERREALTFMRDVGATAGASQPQWDTAASWERLVARRSARSRRMPLRLTPGASERQAPRWRRPAAAAAAAVILLAVGTLAGVRSRRGTTVPQGAASVPAAGAMRVYTTSPGQRATFHLPDGSSVILGVASRLRYPSSFNATTGRRDVYLEGQALFAVQHNPRRPFLVHTTRAVTEDLGTKFTVQEYAGDTTMQVVVVEGSVELRAQGRTGAGALLRPGQVGQLTRNGDALVRSDVDLAQQLAWTEGRLVFDDVPLRDALPQLRRWYDLEFVLGDTAIGARPLTAALAGESVAETLKLLSSALDVDYELRGWTVTFLPRHRAR